MVIDIYLFINLCFVSVVFTFRFIYINMLRDYWLEAMYFVIVRRKKGDCL